MSPKIAWAPAPFGGTGPCFAARETSGMLQIIMRRTLRLAFALTAARDVVRDFGAPFRSGMWSGDGALTLVAPGSLPLARRSHGYPVFLPAFPSAGGCVAFALPVHDDVMTFSPVRFVCQ